MRCPSYWASTCGMFERLTPRLARIARGVGRGRPMSLTCTSAQPIMATVGRCRVPWLYRWLYRAFRWSRGPVLEDRRFAHRFGGLATRHPARGPVPFGRGRPNTDHQSRHSSVSSALSMRRRSARASRSTPEAFIAASMYSHRYSRSTVAKSPSKWSASTRLRASTTRLMTSMTSSSVAPARGSDLADGGGGCPTCSASHFPSRPEFMVWACSVAPPITVET